MRICGSSAICSHFISISCCQRDGEAVVGVTACTLCWQHFCGLQQTLKPNGCLLVCKHFFVRNFQRLDFASWPIHRWLCVCVSAFGSFCNPALTCIDNDCLQNECIIAESLTEAQFHNWDATLQLRSSLCDGIVKQLD